ESPAGGSPPLLRTSSTTVRSQFRPAVRRQGWRCYCNYNLRGNPPRKKGGNGANHATYRRGTGHLKESSRRFCPGLACLKRSREGAGAANLRASPRSEERRVGKESRAR